MNSQNQAKILEAKAGGMDSIGLAKMQQAAVQDEQRARVELAKRMVANAKRLEKAARGTDEEQDAVNERLKAEAAYTLALNQRQLALLQQSENVSKVIADKKKEDQQAKEKREKEAQKKRDDERNKLQKDMNDLLQ